MSQSSSGERCGTWASCLMTPLLNFVKKKKKKTGTGICLEVWMIRLWGQGQTAGTYL